jgi:hypothetical protein
MKRYTTKLLLLLAACAGIASCQNKPADTVNQTADSVTKTTDVVAQTTDVSCYAYTKNRDTVMLTIKTTGDQVAGDLAYKIYEKDRNMGTVSGKLHGDTLLLDYTFASEGAQSVREVAFLKKDSTLTEGYADVEEKSGKVVFKRAGDLKFNGSIVLSKTACATQ